MKKSLSLVSVVIFVLVLAGCPSTQRAPVQPVIPVTGTGPLFHTVEKGQTLYRIAKTYHVTVNDLMQTNNIANASTLEVGQRLKIPGTGGVAQITNIAGMDQIRRLVEVRHPAVWRTITVHHSGTVQGSAKGFHRDHLRRGMGGLFYHFVIGNGTSSRDGLIEVGFRWRKQIKSNRPNDINICLVGDFNRQQVTERQMASLVSLIRVLEQQYAIPTRNVRKHEDIKGKHTACPGRYFPYSRLVSEISS